MSAFDKVIGYETIKNELMQICDMIHNRELYENLGARLPRGIMLYGEPGLGKTLMAKCFIEESGLKAFTIRKNKSSENFIESIGETFEKAKENAPSIVFLDDMDKFSNEDGKDRDAEEFVAIQAGIKKKKNCDVFVLATVNKNYTLPRSLTRSGRFDRKIRFYIPEEKDVYDIIRYYLSNKKLSGSVNIDDLSKMFVYSSCAELENILNEAAIYAAFKRKDSIHMEDLIESVLKMQYDSSTNFTGISADDIKKIALHEAGHLVVSEVLEPGSVGLAALCSKGGFVHRCKELSDHSYYVMVSLAGKAAAELYYADSWPKGSESDIKLAFENIRNGLSVSGTHGFGMIDVADHRFPVTSESMNSRNEAVTQAELERYMIKTKDILLKNRDFLEKAAEALMEKKTLLYSDIKRLRESINNTASVA